MRARHTLGFPLDGVLREYIAVPAEDAVHAPGYLTDVQAVALPIAGVTAWMALTAGGVQPGNWVLAMGTGGVAIFTLQFEDRGRPRRGDLVERREAAARPVAWGRCDVQLSERSGLRPRFERSAWLT